MNWKSFGGGIVLGGVGALMLAYMAGCDGGGDDQSNAGTSSISGTVAGSDFSSNASAAMLKSALDGIIVVIDGPVSESATTDAGGSFSFTGLPAGDYTLSFSYQGQEVTYRGNSGQTATITVNTNENVELTSIRISGGHVNIGNIHISETSNSATNSATGT
jgi:hypothetical protein